MHIRIHIPFVFFIASAIGTFFAASAARADDLLEHFHLSAFLDQASQVQLPEDELLTAIRTVIPGLTVRDVGALLDESDVPIVDDAFFFNFSAALVVEGEPLRAWSVSCTRYGWQTRDYLHSPETRTSHQAVDFGRETRRGLDDHLVWPPGALAVLNCEVALLTDTELAADEPQIGELFSARFASVEWRDWPWLDGMREVVALEPLPEAGIELEGARLSYSPNNLVTLRVRSFLPGIG